MLSPSHSNAASWKRCCSKLGLSNMRGQQGWLVHECLFLFSYSMIRSRSSFCVILAQRAIIDNVRNKIPISTLSFFVEFVWHWQQTLTQDLFRKRHLQLWQHCWVMNANVNASFHFRLGTGWTTCAIASKQRNVKQILCDTFCERPFANSKQPTSFCNGHSLNSTSQQNKRKQSNLSTKFVRFCFSRKRLLDILWREEPSS